MYDELVKRLRLISKSHGEFIDLYGEAADAIEELSREAEVNAKRAMKWAFDAEEAEAKLRWIPVTEGLPEDLQNVLVIDDGRVTIGHCEHYYGEEEVYVEWHDTLYYPIDPPYWMPLPEPPKEG